jgi:hypothetical protein
VDVGKIRWIKARQGGEVVREASIGSTVRQVIMGSAISTLAGIGMAIGCVSITTIDGKQC